MFMFKNFFERISSDFRQRELLPLKLLFFVHSSTLFVLYPYLTIHMRELGINVEEAAIMSAVTPIVAIIMPPIAGVIADRIGNFKVILSLFSAMGGLASLLLLLVPVGRIVISFPNMTVLEVSANQSFIEMRVSEPYPCFRNKSETIELFANMQACGVICNRRPEGFTPYERGPRTLEEEKTAILGARSYSVLVRDDSTDAFTYSPRAEDLPVFRSNVKDDVRNSKIMTNKGNFASSIRMLAPNRFFFPTRGLYTWACIADADNITCSIVLDKNGPTSGARFISKAYAVKLDNVHSEGEEGSIFRTFRILEMRPSFGNHSSWNYLPVASASPGNESVLVIDVPLPSRDNGLEVDATLELNDCSPKCIATVPRSAICTNKDSVSEFDISLTFWMYLSIRVFIGMISGTAFAMFEGAVIAILREHKADYGLQRIYATIGGMISSPLSGYLIDYASRNKLYTDFRPAFYLYAGLKILSAGLMLTINLEFKSPATNVLADVVTVLKKIEIVALFITCFILGTAWGYIESFLFWLLQDLGASRSLMGITITVGGIAGLPLLVMSGPIIDRIGHANVLFIGFVFYAIRLLGYSLIYNPWMCLIFEAMESVTSSLSFTAAVTYAAKLSTTTTDSSIQGLLGGLYFGVGKGAGSLIGGYLMQYVGTRPTYQIFAAVTLITGCLYFLFNYFYIERHPDRLAKGSTTEVKWNEKPKQPEKPCETKPPLNPSPSVNHNSSRKWKNAAAATNTTTTTNASVKSPDATLDLSAGMVNNVIKNKTNYGAVNGAFDKADEIIAADTTTSPVEVKVVGESERR